MTGDITTSYNSNQRFFDDLHFLRHFKQVSPRKTTTAALQCYFEPYTFAS